MLTPVVSVVVPTCNRRRVLMQALRGILVQSVPLQVLLVEDGTTGAAADVVRTLDDDRVRVICNVGRHGAGAARNVGVQAATGRWLAFCDDDDIWAPGKLTAQLAALGAADAGWSCTSEITVDADLRVIGHRRIAPDSVLHLPSLNVIPGGGSGVVADARLVRAAGGFDETLSNAEDWDLWIRLSQLSTLAVVDQPLVAYREWPQSKGNNVRGMTTSFATVLERYGATPSTTRLDYARARYLARQHLRAGHRRAAASAYLATAVSHHTIGDVARAAGALTSPAGMQRAGTRRARRRIPTPWLQVTEKWLAAYRDQSTAQVSAS